MTTGITLNGQRIESATSSGDGFRVLSGHVHIIDDARVVHHRVGRRSVRSRLAVTVGPGGNHTVLAHHHHGGELCIVFQQLCSLVHINDVVVHRAKLVFGRDHKAQQNAESVGVANLNQAVWNRGVGGQRSELYSHGHDEVIGQLYARHLV